MPLIFQVTAKTAMPAREDWHAMVPWHGEMLELELPSWVNHGFSLSATKMKMPPTNVGFSPAKKNIKHIVNT